MNLELRLKKGAFNHVESELFHYHETKREIERMKQDILLGTSSFDENVGGGKSNLPGDPTASKAIAMISNRQLEQMHRIVKAIEFIVEGLPDEKKKLVELKYWTRPQTLTWDGIAMRLNCSRRSALIWREEIVTAIGNHIGWK